MRIGGINKHHLTSITKFFNRDHLRQEFKRWRGRVVTLVQSAPRRVREFVQSAPRRVRMLAGKLGTKLSKIKRLARRNIKRPYKKTTNSMVEADSNHRSVISPLQSGKAEEKPLLYRVSSFGGEGLWPDSVIDRLLILSRYESPAPEVKQEFEAVRQEYIYTALRVVKKEISQSDDPDIKQKLAELKQQLEKELKIGNLEFNVKGVMYLKRYPQAFAKTMKHAKANGNRVLSSLLEKQPQSLLKTDVNLIPKSTYDHKELFKLKTLQFEAAKKVIARELTNKTENNELVKDSPLGKRLINLDEQLDGEFERLKQTVSLKGDAKLTPNEIKAEKGHYSKLLIAALAETGIDKRTVEQKFTEAKVDVLNSRNWKTLTADFEYNQHRFVSVQTPASKMMVKVDGKSKQVFPSYENGGGVSSTDMTNTKHATNLYRSEFNKDGKTAYIGIRHGVADPYKIKRGKAKGSKKIASFIRRRGARAKAKEILVAALATKPELFEQARQAAENDSLNVPTLITTSTSLLTTGLGSAGERAMQKHQDDAFSHFTSGEPVILRVSGPDGTSYKLKVKFKHSRFNMPVNWGGVGPVSFLTDGRYREKKKNDQAMFELIGSRYSKAKGEVGGLAEEWLLDAQKRMNEMSEKTGKEIDKSTLKKEIDRLKSDVRSVKDLVDQIGDIYFNERHHAEHHDAYKLAVRITLLTHYLGGVPISNCKSGKDRTSLLDAELKLLLARIDSETGEIPKPGMLSDKLQKLFEEILRKSANHEIQEANTGVRGFKIRGIKCFYERGACAESRGLSEAIGS